MYYFVGIVSLLFLHTVFAQNGCPMGLTSDLELLYNFGGSCYYFSPTALSYSQANNSCSQTNGYLAVITDNATQTALAAKADEVSDITGRSSYWIGLRRVNSTYTSSVLGDSVQFMSYSTAQSTGTGNSGCVKLDLPDANGNWVTDNCASNIWFSGHICQYTGSSAVKTGSVPGLILLMVSLYVMV